jgi:hypothetical protein
VDEEGAVAELVEREVVPEVVEFGTEADRCGWVVVVVEALVPEEF